MPTEIRFYLDENVDNQITKGLRAYRIHVLTTAEAGLIGWKDEQHLAFALAEGCVIFTQDRDFLRLHAQGRQHAGIIYCKQQTRTIKQILRGLILIYEILELEDMRNNVEFL
jgi:predicted nuclease of predicted toxin-antitoxin system